MRILYPKFHITYFPDDIFIIDQVLWPSFDNPTEEEQKHMEETSHKAGIIASQIIKASYIPIEPIKTATGYDLFAVEKDVPIMRFSSQLQIDAHLIIPISIISGPCFDVGLIKTKNVTVH